MKWATLVHDDRTVYNKAAKVLLKVGISDAEFSQSAQIVSNWRSSHAYPLHAITMSLRTRVNKIDHNGIVVQRLKRLASIIPKLERMRLTQIQDIGGCRTVLRDLKHLNKLHKIYQDAAAKKDKRRPYLEGAPDNYIANPKNDGYRGIHYVFRYRSEQKEYRKFNEIKIEVQLRTRAQHSWATAVEIVDLFTGQSLKTDISLNKATPDWKRFFALMGTVIAISEDCPIVPNTPLDMTALVPELRAICDRLDIIPKLEGYGSAVDRAIATGTAKGGAYLVKIDTEKRMLSVTPYPLRERKQLEKDYIRLEIENLKNRHVQVAQVAARSFDEFKRAYPNYDLDTSSFVQTILKTLDG